MDVRFLPEPEEKFVDGAKPVESDWIDAANMQKVVNGDMPTKLIPEKDIFVREARTGIGRDNQRSVVKDGQLYFTRHVRLKEDITLAMGLSGADQLPNEGMLRLGGEGRLARMLVDENPKPLLLPSESNHAKGLVLMLLTHGDFGGKETPDWRDVHPNLELVTACIGKPVREGGWNYASRRPKPLKSLVPAGSCYFMTVKDGNLEDVILSLHYKQIGQRGTFGYGEIVVGLWK